MVNRRDFVDCLCYCSIDFFNLVSSRGYLALQYVEEEWENSTGDEGVISSFSYTVYLVNAREGNFLCPAKPFWKLIIHCSSILSSLYFCILRVPL